jgi:hypothetical protein
MNREINSLFYGNIYLYFREKIFNHFYTIGIASCFLVFYFCFYSRNLINTNMSIDYFFLSIMVSVILLSAVYIISYITNYFLIYKNETCKDESIKANIIGSSFGNQNLNIQNVENKGKNNLDVKYSKWGVKLLSLSEFTEECITTTEREKRKLFKSEKFQQMIKEKGYDESKWNWQLEARKRGEMNVISDDELS